MVWHDLKTYVRSIFCQTFQEVINAIENYWLFLTPEKCQKFKLKLKDVRNITIIIILYQS